jgi:hypothetical protein
MKILNLLKKVIVHIKRKIKAHNIGIEFNRNKDFNPPSSVRIGNQSFSLLLPKERGVSELFRDIILDDEYWLHSLPACEIKNILDVGANIGLFSVAARICFPQACIHAYEPNLGVK